MYPGAYMHGYMQRKTDDAMHAGTVRSTAMLRRKLIRTAA